MRLLFILLPVLAFTAFSCGGSSEASSNASTTEVPAEPANMPEESNPPAEAATPEATKMAQQSAPPVQGPFEEKLTEGPVTFIVESPNAKRNYFTLNTEGMSVRNEETKVDVNGQVVRAQLADLNQDSYPEVYIFTRGEGGIENVYAFASYRNRSYGQIYMAEAEQYATKRGYQGGDTYELTETRLIRSFSLSEEGQRTAESQTVEYALKKGETSYRLEPVE